MYGPTGVIAAEENSDDPAIVFTDITGRSDVQTFNHKARHGFYDERLPRDEPRSLTRNAF